MNEKLIRLNYETIGVKEQRQLFDFIALNKALTHEEFMEIVNVYKKVVDRLAKELPENK